MKWILRGILVMCLVACGKEAKVASVNLNRSSGDALAPLDCRNKPGQGNLAMNLQQGDFRHIPAEELVARHEDTPVSLCGMMRANPEIKLAVIQFASLDCYQCLKWIDRLHGEIDQYGLEVIQVPILAGSPERSTEADLLSLKSSLAGDALWLRDSTGELWRFFTPDLNALEKVSPLTVIMDLGARGFSTSEAGKGLKELIENANTTLKVGLPPVSTPKP